MPNILEAIAGLCDARCNTKMLTEILTDYIRQNEPDPTYRKARLKAAKRMLG